MATIQNGLSGGFSGAVGNIIGSSWRGIDIMRGKPEHYRDANSEQQKEIRMRFKGLSKFSKTILNDIIRPIWENKTKKVTGTNAFMQSNYEAFDKEGKLVNYDKLNLSMGILRTARSFSFAADTETKGLYNLKWDCYLSNDVSDQNDILRIIIMDKDDKSNNIYELETNAVRKDKKASVDLSDFELATVEVFLFFESKTKNIFSENKHLEIEVPALQ